MHYLFFTVGTTGDLNPYLGLAEEMQRRGHRVTLLSDAHYQEFANRVGLNLIPVGDSRRLQEYVTSAEYFDASKTWKLATEICFLGPMRDTYRVIAEHHRREPIVVASAAWGLGARIAHDKLNVPLATIHLEPHNVRSLYQTGVMPPPMVLHDWVPRFFKRLQFWMADRWFVDPRLGPQVNRFRAELGLSPVQRLVDQWWHSPQQIIGMYPEWFAPPQPDWPSQLKLVGFPLWDKLVDDETSDEIIPFAMQRRPIVFTAGSNNTSAPYFDVAIRCCDQLGVAGLMITGQSLNIPARMESQIKVARYVRFGKLLPHASAIVHHGGAGTTAQALAAGIPQLIIPTVHGTPDIAAKLSRLGCSTTLRPTAFRTDLVVPAMRRLLGSQHVAEQCRKVQRRMRADHAIERAGDLLEQLGDHHACTASRSSQ